MVFHHVPDRTGARPAERFKTFRGILQVDGYAGSEVLADKQRTITALDRVLALVEPGYRPEAGHASRRRRPPRSATTHVVANTG